MPRELAKASLPDYRIEPPDVLLIDAVRIVSRGVVRIVPMDVLLIQATSTLPDEPINGPYVVAADGTVNLGPSYRSVAITGMTPEEAQQAIETHLRQILRAPTVSVSIIQSASKQQVAGEHLVGPDGTVNLGTYGNVYVTGATIDEARVRIEAHLSQFLQQPEVAVDVVGYNSKVYYVITEGAGFGDAVTRMPVTGNETVLDAIAHINGLSQVSSKKIWIARPAPNDAGCEILPVNWIAITRGASTTTNYQIMPGDRLFVQQDSCVALDTALGKLLSPAERIFGFTLLGASTVQTINRFPKGYLTPSPVVVQ
ncbi:MAG TPA: polysaccharide biosynthesis/export family protein [Pirellulales bacterium]|nr:polysaccharide biosynthesis/export family protein [Pirellulales bacterium]